MSLYIEFTRHYKRDAVETELTRYGTLALDEIEQDLKMAEISFIDGGMTGLDRLSMQIPGERYYDPWIDVSYTANRNQGVLANGNPLPRNRSGSINYAGGAFRFPNYGYLFENPELEVEVTDFSVEEWVPEPFNASLVHMKQYIYRIHLQLTMEYPGSEETQTKIYNFERLVFQDRKTVP